MYSGWGLTMAKNMWFKPLSVSKLSSEPENDVSHSPTPRLFWSVFVNDKWAPCSLRLQGKTDYLSLAPPSCSELQLVHCLPSWLRGPVSDACLVVVPSLEQLPAQSVSAGGCHCLHIVLWLGDLVKHHWEKTLHQSEALLEKNKQRDKWAKLLKRSFLFFIQYNSILFIYRAKSQEQLP